MKKLTGRGTSSTVIRFRGLQDFTFTNSFVDELPGEQTVNNHSRRVPGVCYSPVTATPVNDPHLLAWSDSLAAFLGITRPAARGIETDILGGNRTIPSMKPYAARYGGHQFGVWAGQLGDGRAISLGELQAFDGSRWELQLKGAGPTPYARRADGRAVLRSSLREFLCSEAMHALGVPTTRALALVGTGDTVMRDMFYSGDPREEKGAIVTRVAPSFVRFGNFEMLAASGEEENLRLLADYVIRHYYPELGEPSETVYGAWFEEIARRTAVMIVHWMTLGFVHGVMNTDNMSILGLTIDYGPFGWLEPYDPEWTPNTTDFGQRRYAFGRQPQVALWNLAMLASALAPLVSDEQLFRTGLDRYRTTVSEQYRLMMFKKIGLTTRREDEDVELLETLPDLLAGSEIDMTIFFRTLAHTVRASLSSPATDPDVDVPRCRELIHAATYAPNDEGRHRPLLMWLDRYLRRARREGVPGATISAGMLAVNPKFVPRNYLAQTAIDAAEQGDLSVLETLIKVLARPYDDQPEHEQLAAKRPEWARERPGCATLSCSS